MCGIAGIIAPDDRDLSAIIPITNKIAHRGPDGEGFLVDSQAGLVVARGGPGLGTRTHGQVALGHRRLAIIDTNERALQPLAREGSDTWIVFNGEIYNFIELREDLKSLGHVFTTTSDTEVILAAYTQWGTGCFSRFNGMWALALYDRRRRVVVLSRDRLGVKPLHMAVADGALVFASEIKAILASKLVSAKADWQRLMLFLRHGLINVDDGTCFDGISLLPPGHFAEVSIDDPTSIKPVAFWHISAALKRDQDQLSFGDAVERFRSLFLSAVDLRMRSDVPVGACLSGGLDSSSIVCAFSRDRSASETPLTSVFTSAFPGTRHDESIYAEAVVQQTGARMHKVVPTLDGLINDLPTLIETQDEPFTTPSIYAQWLLMREARRSGVPVLLDGQGGDEALCGYRKYLYFHLFELNRKGHYGSASAHAWNMSTTGDRGALDISNAFRYLPGWLQTARPSISTALKPAAATSWHEASFALTDRADVELCQIDDLRRYSVPALLRYCDRNSMAWGIESRLPFLDYRVIEFALSLNSSLKVRNGQTKALLRSGMRGLVPDIVLDRRDKMGFETPEIEWITGRLRPWMTARFQADDFFLKDVFDPTRLVELFDTKGFTRPPTIRALFRVFVVDQWAQQYRVTR